MSDAVWLDGTFTVIISWSVDCKFECYSCNSEQEVYKTITEVLQRCAMDLVDDCCDEDDWDLPVNVAAMINRLLVTDIITDKDLIDKYWETLGCTGYLVVLNGYGEIILKMDSVWE